jgi:alkyl hydroperoxide reductase subunit AhpC
MTVSKLRLGDIAPDFNAQTTQGEINFHNWKLNSWTILFSHPEDFTPVCTTELGACAKLSSEFQSRNVKILGLSCNTLESHHEWILDINETQDCKLEFPIIADFDRKVAVLYDMLDYQDATNIDKQGMPLTVRSVFLIDPKNIIRANITYPASTGRNFVEILRMVDSIQLCDSKKVATPANWVPGGQVIVHNSVSDQDAHKMFPGFKTVKPYLRLTTLE